MSASSIQRIAELNDVLRTTFLTGKVVMTEGIASLSEEVIAEIVSSVRAFKDFSEDNDPCGEHDFGALDVGDVGKVFWKIDYYDPAYETGSEDPSDPAKTGRLLTILLANEW